MGKKTTSTKSTSSPPTFAVPLIQGASNDILSNYNANQPNIQNIESGITGSTIPGLQQQIGDTKQQLQPGMSYLNSTLSPGYLQTGQAQAQALGNYAGQQAGNQINSAFSQAGRTGGGYNVSDTARGVTQAQLAPMLQNLQYNQGIQGQAAGMLPSYTNAQYTGYTPLLGAQQLAGQLPFYGTNSLASMGQLFGNYGTTTGQQPGGVGSDILSAAVAALPFIPGISDRRLKTNIRKLGEAKDGLGIYEWNWKRDPNGPTVHGVIADEVEKLRPWAFVPNFVGQFAGVNYGALGSME